MAKPKSPFQIMLGVLLLVLGIMMFITIPGRVREIQDAGKYIFGLRFGLYFVSVFMMVGGCRKIYEYTLATKNKDDEP